MSNQKQISTIMKKHFYFLSLLLGLAISMTGFTSCCNDDDTTTPQQQPQVVTPSLNLDFASIDPQFVVNGEDGEQYVQLTAGESLDIPFKVEPAELASQIVLTSSDPSIVAVEGMKLNALKAGRVTITAKAGEMETAFNVVVKAALVDLSQLTADYTAQDGDVLTGTLGANVKISVADGATVTLKDVTITNLGNNCDWAGINCPDDATLVLEGTNTVCAGRGSHEDNNYPGIWIASGKTLTIQGDGTLTAYSNASKPSAAGIGGGYEIACGNIVINSGTITATGGEGAAGIGGGLGVGCGNITINGGTVTATGGYYGAGIGSGNYASCGTITISGGTVEATGGSNAAGIGGGRNNGACGTITITSGVTKVKATKGEGAPNSIGKGNNGQDITVNIENGTNVTLAPVTVTWNYLNFDGIPYTKDGVTLTPSNDRAAMGDNFYDYGDNTFTTTLGKFTKIEIVCKYPADINGWTQEIVESYQPFPNEDPDYWENIYKMTWTGNAESVIIQGKNVSGMQSITFTIQ